MSAEKVLITGASGFVGFHLVRRLKELGRNVCCLVRSQTAADKLKPFQVETVFGDVTDLDSLKSALHRNIGTVFHLAGLTRAYSSNHFMQVNRFGTKNVVESCLSKETPPCLLSLSSLAAAGSAPKGRKKRENDVPNPCSPYGKSKLAGEKELILHAQELPITVLRPPIVFGEYDTLGVELFRMAKTFPFFLIPGYIDRRFSFVYAADLAEQLILLERNGERLTPYSLPNAVGKTKAENAKIDKAKIFENKRENDGLKDSDSSGKYSSSEYNSNEYCSGEGIYFVGFEETPRFSEFGRMLTEVVGRKKYRSLFCPPLGVLGTGIVQEIYKRITKKNVSLDWNKALEGLSGPWICEVDKVRQKTGFRPEFSLTERLQQTANWYQEHGFFS